MTLTGWIEYDKGLIDSVIDLTGSRNSGCSWVPSVEQRAVEAGPKTRHYTTVGMAFDYAFRMKVSIINRQPESFMLGSAGCEGDLVARAGVRESKRRKSFYDSLFVDWMEEAPRTWKTGAAGFLESKLADCIVLAKLESVYRSGQDFGDDDIFSIDPADVDDLRSLVGLVQPRAWLAKKQLVLNPTFQQSGEFVGKADADLVFDGTLVDIKTTKFLSLKREYLRQLMGYYILNLRENDLYQIHSLGVYFSRFGVLYSFRIPFSPADPVVGECYRDSGNRLCPAAWFGTSVWDDIEQSLREYRVDEGLS